MTRLRPFAASAAAAALLCALTILSAAAQEPPTDSLPAADFPPLPVLFSGTASLDGQPVAEGRLSVRVGDWETRRPVAVVDGAFACAHECLTAGPPSLDYIDEPVTFVLDGGLTATLTFPIPQPERA